MDYREGDFAKEGFDLWLVGGGVRNLLTGKGVTDLDFTTNATPEQIQKIFPDSFYDNNFGTVGIPVKKSVKSKTDRTSNTNIGKGKKDTESCTRLTIS